MKLNDLMSAKSRRPLHRDETYFRETLKPLYGLIFVFPMLLAFHYGTRNIRIDILVLSRFRGAAAYIPPMALILVLGVQHLARRDRFSLRWRVFGGMLVESVLWVLPLMAVSHVTALLFLTATQPASASRLDSILIGMGGGIYEEFAFHLLGIGLTCLILVKGMSAPKIPVVIIATIVTAVLFSLSHFNNDNPYSNQYFAFYTIAGLHLGALFITRGFGIAAGAHVMWNIYIFVM